MKRFIVQVEDDNFTRSDLNSVLYLGGNSDETPSNLRVFAEATATIEEENVRADGTHRMTTKQRDKLWELCGRYNVPFRESDYEIYQGAFKGLLGMAEGWIGGPMMNGHNNQGKTIYVGVTPDGIANS